MEVSTEIAKLSFNKDGTAQGLAKQCMIETLAKPVKRVINDPYAEKFTLGSGFLIFLGHNTLVWMTKKVDIMKNCKTSRFVLRYKLIK